MGALLTEINAQQIKGKVFDSESNELLPYANVALQKMPINRIVTGGVTDIAGEFNIKTELGTYNVIVRVVGFMEYTVSGVKVEDKTVDVGEIKLKATAIQLSEVAITAKRSYIENKPGKQILNVGREIAGGGGNITQVLKILPAVEVTPRGDISIRGNENIKVLINGKEMAYGIDAKTLLKQLPAATVEKIEVITNASVSEDPESAGGAINIILKKNSNDGLHYGANLEVGMIPFRGNGGFTMNYAKNKFNTYLTVGAYVDNFDFSNEGTRTFESGASEFKSISDKGKGKYQDIGQLVLGGVDYDISDNTSLNLEFTHNRYKEEWEYDLDNKFILYSSENMDAFVRNENIEKIRFTDVSVRLESKPKENHKLTSLIHYSGGSTDSKRSILEKGSYFTEEATTAINSDAMYNMGELSLDYTMPIAKKSTLEFGINSELLTYTADQKSLGYYTEDKKWDYNQQKHAAYVMLKHKFEKLSVGLGVRPEYYKSVTIEKINNERIPQEYTSLFPNVQIEYNFGTPKIIQNLNLSYSKRIRRPSAEELDPIADYANPSHIYQGNPRLKPEFINSVELAYNFLKGNKKLNLTFFGRQTNNVIQMQTKLIESGTLHTTYINHSSSKDLGVEMNAKIKPIDKWESTLGASFIRSFYAKMKTKQDVYNKKGISWSLKWNNYLTINPKSTVQFQVQYYGKTQGLFYTRKPYYVTNIGFERQVLKGIGTLGLSINDIFNSGGKENYTIKGPGFVSNSEWMLNSRTFRISFNFFIN
jgi:outer membrane receptor protein involved in Fe transport